MMTKKQFDVLTILESDNKLTTSNISIADVGNTIKELQELNYIKDDIITDSGVQALEPYKVKRAIFIAAGFGERLMPITLNTPKPLVKVHGKRIIETLLDAIVDIGITEIYIVRGYLAEQFDILLNKYPTIKFIENPDYCNGNNILSAFYSKDKFENSYVLEGDLHLKNKNLITKYQYSSNYLTIPIKQTNDWCFELKNGYIENVMIGGYNCYQMVGISYWSADDGKKINSHLEEIVKSPGGRELFWDEVALKKKKEFYNISIRECSFEDIVEIDTFNELKTIDKAYDC